jgi:hypothetical protein
VTVAHVSGVPVEELLPLALASGGTFVAAARVWLRDQRAGRRRDAR